MFGEGHDDSIVQRGIDEALACRDMLEPAPIPPSPLARMMSAIGTALRAIIPDPRHEREDQHQTTPPAAGTIR